MSIYGGLFRKRLVKAELMLPDCLTAYERFFNFYGFHGARLSVDQSVRKSEPKSRLWLFTILSFFLFNAPDTHLARLEKLWTDETIKGRLWTIFKSKLEDDWQSFVLYVRINQSYVDDSHS